MDCSTLCFIFGLYFFEPQEQEDLVQILYYSGAFEEDEIRDGFANIDYDNPLLKHLETQGILDTIQDSNCSTLDHKEENSCDSKKILENFNTKNPLHTLDWLIQSTQEKIFARTGERWEAKTPLWMASYPTELSNIIHKLDPCKEVEPQKQFYENAAVFGATYNKMNERLQYLKVVLKQTRNQDRFTCSLVLGNNCR